MNGSLSVLRLVVPVLACVCIAQASAVHVFPGELTSASTGTAAGKLILHDNYAVFLDEKRPEDSFSIARGEMQNFNVDGAAVTAQLSGDSRFSFRLDKAADAPAVQRWYSAAAPAAPTAAGTPRIDYTWEVQQKRRFKSDNRGRLMLAGDMLIFESIENPSDSRRWTMKGIKSLQHKNPYRLDVETFRDGSYTFEMFGSPMEPEQYRTLVNRVTAARVK